MSDPPEKEEQADKGDKVKQSRMVTVKKGIASKVLSTKKGRNEVLKFLGPMGTALIEVTESLFVKHLGKKDGEEKKADLIKLAAKGKILWDEKSLKEEKVVPLRDPLILLAYLFLEWLSPAHKLRMPPKDLQQELQAQLTETHRLGMEIIKPLMAEKNSSKVTRLYEVISSKEFLDKLREDPEYAAEKDVALQNLEAILSVLPGAAVIAETRAPCIKSGCFSRKVPKEEGADEKGSTNFKGSDLCALHHYLTYSVNLEKPEFMLWLREDLLRNEMRPYYISKRKEVGLDFLHALTGYRSIANKEMRHIRAEKIMDKFIKSKAVVLSDATEKAIQTALEGKNVASTSLFSDASQEVIAQLSKEFKDGYLASEEFKQLKELKTLPEHIRTKVAEQHANARKASLMLKNVTTRKFFLSLRLQDVRSCEQPQPFYLDIRRLPFSPLPSLA
eukprot:g30567.t1